MSLHCSTTFYTENDNELDDILKEKIKKLLSSSNQIQFAENTPLITKKLFDNNYLVMFTILETEKLQIEDHFSFHIDVHGWWHQNQRNFDTVVEIFVDDYDDDVAPWW